MEYKKLTNFLIFMGSEDQINTRMGGAFNTDILQV